ncbi:hypothetical protein Bca52824_054419 [Brassica carinata]|uniref:Hyaluronan/mRNA-binding protein domain-containing protein n=1 Tax=Brassica carinata TaxID=52824 RepID=A0A8X7ULT5_BRACI|nr:hypothetical protein Bca52824_054419 [Brassica carinata]
MSTLNPFDLLGGDAEDPSQIVVSLPKKVEKEAPAQPAKGAKLQTKQPPTSQAVRESRNAPSGVRGGGAGRGPPRGSFNPGGDRPHDLKDGERTSGFRRYRESGGRGGQRGGPANGRAGDGRVFERRSGTGQPEDKEMTLEEYEKILEEKKKALQATKVEERKVDTKVFESMQQLSSKKTNNEEIFIKLGSDKDKRKDAAEKEEKAKKSLSINEFLKPADGERYNPRGGGYRGRGGRNGGRGQRDEKVNEGAPAPPSETVLSSHRWASKDRPLLVLQHLSILSLYSLSLILFLILSFLLHFFYRTSLSAFKL